MPGHTDRLPPWLRARQVRAGGAHALRARLRGGGLHTVCEEARCPNAGECFGAGTATFLVLGDVCTRDCSFCAVKSGPTAAPDPDEPHRVACAAREMNLRHVVITSVTRDDLPDGGAAHFAKCVSECRRAAPGATVEVLIPDFGGDAAALEVVLGARPDVLNHNIETVRALYPRVRPQADYARSLALLFRSGRFRSAGSAGGGVSGRVPPAGSQPSTLNPQPVIKTGLMIGLGETRSQLRECFGDLRGAGVEVLTIGQYLRPRKGGVEVVRYHPPDEFEKLAEDARAAGIPTVFSGPLVRSSYHAAETLARARRGR